MQEEKTYHPYYLLHNKYRKCVCGQYFLPGMIPRIGPELEDAISTWVHIGNLEPLEQVLLAGYGHLLEGRSSRIPRVAIFLRNLQIYKDRIEYVHKIAKTGKLTELARFLDQEGEIWATSRDNINGTTPLQKAMLSKHFAASKLLIKRVPCSIHIPDRMGRTPLHYAAALDATDCGDLWYQLFLESGADENIKDLFGRKAEFYREKCIELVEKPVFIIDDEKKKERKDKENKKTKNNVKQQEDEDDVIIFHVTVEIREEKIIKEEEEKQNDKTLLDVH